MPPHIVTAALDEVSFARLDALRKAHFPPERNHLRAHLTLFHALPREAAAAALEAVVHPPIRFRVEALMPLGRGVAYRIGAPELLVLHAKLQGVLGEHLTDQDRQPLRRPHVTVQNKVEPDAAKALLKQLHEDFTPWEGEIDALVLHRYDGGPWTTVARYPLASA